ncbi:MAG: septum formation initiator family protein [Roseiarcus sp.]|jgi:cell division protein FtsB
MAVKTRARAILIPIVFYLVLGSTSAWLVWGASQGERGLNAKAQYEGEVTKLEGQLAELKTEHDRWRRRVESMRSEAVDRDLLDEEARAMLDRVSKDDVVIFVPATKTN